MATPKIREGTVSEFPVAAPSSSPTFSPGEMTQSPAQGSQGHRLAQLGQALMEVAHEVRSSLGAMQLCAGLLEEQLTEDRHLSLDLQPFFLHVWEKYSNRN